LDDVFGKASTVFNEEVNKLLVSLSLFDYVSQQEASGFSNFEEMDEGWYKGELEKAVRHGRGVLLTEDYLYQGSWSFNQKHGLGRMLKGAGDLFAGYYSNDMRKGFGVLTTLLGLTYIGDWKHDSFNGWGRLKTPRGTYEGQFVNGCFEGKGELLFEDGSVYKGAFSKGWMHGYGVYKFNDWCYNAMWSEGKATSCGVSRHQSLLPVAEPVKQVVLTSAVADFFFQDLPEFAKMYPYLRAYKARVEKMIDKVMSGLGKEMAEDEINQALQEEVLDQLEDECLYAMQEDIDEEVAVDF
jgi:hypothetical protein